MLDAAACPSRPGAERDTEGAVASGDEGSQLAATALTGPLGEVAGPRDVGAVADTGCGDVSVMPRIGAIATARRSAFQNSPAVCHRSVGLTAIALAMTDSTESLTVAPSVRGVGRRSGFDEETASWMKSSPSSASRPVTVSTTMSASENTSVHGPVEPTVRVNCSGAPYAGVKLVTWPLVLVNVPAIFCASETTLAIPKSSSFTEASPRGSPRTNTLPGLMSRCAMPFR